MSATVIFLSREDAKALAAVLADAVRNPETPVDLGAAKGALAHVGDAVEHGVLEVWADLTPAERQTAGVCWEVLAFERADIGDGQFERIRRRLSS